MSVYWQKHAEMRQELVGFYVPPDT